MKHRPRHAFTLVEILVAISIMTVLVGILYLGAKKIGASSRDRATKVTLKTLQGLLTEYQTRGGDMAKLNLAYYQSAPVGPAIPGQEVMPQNLVSGDSAYTNPNLLSGGNGPLRRTQIVMLTLVSVPENKAILDSLYAKSPELFLKQQNSTQLIPGPILLDAWGSPILFAPGRTNTPQGNVAWGASGMYITGDPNSPSSVQNNPAQWKASHQSADGQGMFISAGPDADFSKGDDNIFSDRQ